MRSSSTSTTPMTEPLSRLRTKQIEERIVAISISCFALISNIIRSQRTKKFQNKQTAANSLKQNSRISSMPRLASHSVSLPRLNTPGVCPTNRRQWADFLVSLMAPLHRQYKTARTETRRHLLLKIRQMPTQTSASRDYVFFSSGKSATRKFLNCLMICGHSPWSAPNLERHGSSKMQTFGWLEIPHFLNRISICISTWNPEVCFW